MSLREYITRRCEPVASGCWRWLLSFGSHGYGNASMPGARVTVAHRVSYRAFKGDIPAGMLVMHSCDNRWCVNPDHLSLGTDKSNSDDKHRKGRANLEGRVFPPMPGRKLTEAQAEEVRASNETHVALAARFGVTPVVIARIRAGRTYRATPHHRPIGPSIFDGAANT